MRDAVARSVAARFFADEVEFTPGSHFEVLDGARASGLVTVGLVVPARNTYDPAQTVTCLQTEEFPTMVFESHPVRVLEQVAHDLVWGHMLHEAGEWLRIGGRRPYDPHAYDR